MISNEGILESWELSLHEKADGTRDLYLRTARWFIDWLTANDRPAAAPGDLLEVSRQDAEAWFGAQRADGLSPSTLRSRWIALRNFYGWLYEEEEIDTNPMERVKVKKVEPDPIRVLEPADIEALLKACQGRDFLDRRDAALVRAFMATGLRLAEMADIRVEDADLRRRILHVRSGKGDRARFVRIDTSTASAIDRYRRARARHRHAELPWLWLSRGGQLGATSIPAVIRRRAEMAGIGHVHPHMFRHWFAHRFLEAGGNEGDLQRLGGWVSPDVMRRYGSAHADDRALAAYDAVNPMEGF